MKNNKKNKIISKPHTLTPGRSKASHLMSDIKGKYLKNPSFQKDAKVIATFAPLGGLGLIKGASLISKAGPGGMIARGLGKTLRTSAKNFSSAVKQYLGKGKKITTPGKTLRTSRDAVLDAKGMLKAKTSLKVQQSAGKGKKITIPRDAVLDAKGLLKAKTSLKNAPSGYYRSDAKGWPLPISSGKMERKRRVLENIRLMKK